jgi:protoheme IX farnesyltransferase
MKRTAKRPLPAGRMDKQSALHFGVGLAGFSLTLMYFAINLIATRSWPCRSCSTCSSTPIWLKRRTPQNIVIGGAAGAFPPLIGWAAATGRRRRRCRSCCSRWSSCGRRRISGRSRCS